MRPSWAGAVAAAHHLLLAHGLGVDALRGTVGAPGAEIGITLNPYPVVAAGEDRRVLLYEREVEAVQVVRPAQVRPVAGRKEPPRPDVEEVRVLELDHAVEWDLDDGIEVCCAGEDDLDDVPFQQTIHHHGLRYTGKRVLGRGAAAPAQDGREGDGQKENRKS